jgi:outer membrane protein OmpA-like peptidoglycan-associated protein
MKRLRLQLGALVICAACGGSQGKAIRTANTADFVAATPPVHVEQALVASPKPDHRIDPSAVVPFLFDQAVLTEEGYAEVDTAARWLQRHPRHRLVLEGHADALGVKPYNEDLSTRRMVAVRDRMLQHGIAADRIVMITFGENEAMPLANPLHPADRHVTMYACQLAPQQIVAMVRENRPAIVATWSERGNRMVLQSGLKQQTQPSITVRR